MKKKGISGSVVDSLSVLDGVTYSWCTVYHCKNTREEEKGELNSQDSQIAKDEKRTERGKRKHYIISKRRFFSQFMKRAERMSTIIIIVSKKSSLTP